MDKPTFVYISDSNIWCRVLSAGGRKARIKHGPRYTRAGAHGEHVTDAKTQEDSTGSERVETDAVDPRARIDIGHFVRGILNKMDACDASLSTCAVFVYGSGLPRSDSVWINPTEMIVKFIQKLTQHAGEESQNSALVADACVVIGQAYPISAQGLTPGRMIFVSGDANVAPAVFHAMAHRWQVCVCCPRTNTMYDMSQSCGALTIDMDAHMEHSIVTHFTLASSSLPMPYHCAFEVEGVVLEESEDVARALTTVTGLAWQTRIAPCIRRDGGYAVMAVCLLEAHVVEEDLCASADCADNSVVKAECNSQCETKHTARLPVSVSWADIVKLREPCPQPFLRKVREEVGDDRGGAEQSENYCAALADAVVQGYISPLKFQEGMCAHVRRLFVSQRRQSKTRQCSESETVVETCVPAPESDHTADKGQEREREQEKEEENIPPFVKLNIRGLKPWWNVKSGDANKAVLVREREAKTSVSNGRRSAQADRGLHIMPIPPTIQPCTSLPPDMAPFLLASGAVSIGAGVKQLPLGMRPALVGEFTQTKHPHLCSRCKHKYTCTYGLACRYTHTEDEISYFIARSTAEYLGWGCLTNHHMR